MGNVNDIYFDGRYKELWRSIIPAELTAKETEFMIHYFSLGNSSKVLDIMCGYGRHALSLARKGIEVTAVDNLVDYINEIKVSSEEEHLPVTAIKSGALEFQSNEVFDLAICMGNSLNFFNAADTMKLLANIHNHLKPHGNLLINTWSLTEIVANNFKEKTWSYVGETMFISESKYLFHPTRIESESFFITPGSDLENKKAIDYVFSVGEMENMIKEAGFKWKAIYCVPGKKEFSVGAPRAYIIVQKS